MNGPDLLVAVLFYAGGFISGASSYRLLLEHRAKKGSNDE